MSRAVKCPECGSGNIEIDPEGEPGDYECEDCGECFTKERRVKPFALRESPDVAARKAFTAQAESIGLEVSLLGVVVPFDGVSFELIGLNTRAPKLPLIMRAQNSNRTMRCTPKWLCIQLKRPYKVPEAAEKANVARDEMTKHGDRYGLDPALVGRILTIGGYRVKFLGLVPRSRSMPISYQHLDDRTYRKCSVERFYNSLGSLEPLIAVTLPPPAPPLPSPPPELVPAVSVFTTPPQPAPLPSAKLATQSPAVKGSGALEGQLSLFS